MARLFCILAAANKLPLPWILPSFMDDRSENPQHVAPFRLSLPCEKLYKFSHMKKERQHQHKTSLAVLLAVAGWCLMGVPWAQSADGPDPIFEKAEPLSMAELAHRTTKGVSAVEVKDYAPGHYIGAMTPSPPHADLNAGKAVVVFWND